jgi:DNA-binding transcriptional ArsR family regulator
MSTIQENRAEPDYDAPDTLLVTEREQLRAIADDLRTRIIALIRDRARSIQELSHELELPKGTVGHHVKVLESAGLIHVVRTRQVRAVTEKFYGRTARLFLFEIEDPEDARALGAAALRQASYELELASDRASWGFVRSRLTSADAKRFERRLKRLIEDFRAAESPEGAAHALVSGFWPAEPSDA